MSGIAQIYDAELDPGKEHVAERFGGVITLLGSYRLVDPAGEVGIEVLVGRDSDGRIAQLPLSYRDSELDPQHTLTEMEHSVLGRRWVSNALGDPVAVEQLIRTILTGDDGAEFSDGTTPVLDILGSGDNTDVTVSEVELTEVTRQRALGRVRIGDRVRAFKLLMQRVPGTMERINRGHNTTRLHLTGWRPEHTGDRRVLAELHWRDL